MTPRNPDGPADMGGFPGQKHDQAPSRRAFLARLGMAGGALLLREPRPQPPVGTPDREGLLCVGSWGKGDSGTLHLFRARNGRCERIGAIASERPAALAAHPALPIVYTANAYAANAAGRHRYEPRGAVEAFHLHEGTGRLALVAQQPLSLSATQPRSLALSPDRRSLLVAAFGGGAYNVLPIDDAGLPGQPTSILKQIGCGPDPRKQTSAHPACVLFHPEEPLGIAADFGADRLDLLSPEIGGAGIPGFSVVSRISCGLGGGPIAVALHRDGRLLVAMLRLRPALASFRLAPSRFEPLQLTSLASEPAALAFHPERDVLYSVVSKNPRWSLLESWRTDAESGALQRATATLLPSPGVRAMHSTRGVLWLTCARGLLAATLDPATAAPRRIRLAAEIPGAASLLALPHI